MNKDDIQKIAEIHFKYCDFCIPGALDLPIEKRLCQEGQELAELMRKEKPPIKEAFRG